MAEIWLTDVRKYVADADENVVGAIVRYCGIALQKPDSSLVAFSDAKETGRVRQNYLRKKLGLTHDDATLDAGIAAIGERMKADRTKNRVTVYYLLADHFDLLDIFGGVKRGAVAAAAVGGGAALTGGAVGLAAMTPPAGAAEPVARPATVSRATSSGGAAPPSQAGRSGSLDNYGYFAWGCGFGLLLVGGIILAALLAWWAARPDAVPAPAPAPVIATPAPTPVAPAPQAAPEGAGVIAGERDTRPMLTVYFDVGKADVTPDFTAAAAPVLAYLEDNAGAMLAISGFNDPTGNAAANAELSKNRAQNVKVAIEALGVAAEKAALEKPAETTGTGTTNTESRRVEVVVKE